jgi:UrcA family protein
MAIAGKLLTGFAVSFVSLACANAYADAPTSSIVHFKDLDLNRSHDVAKLYNRIAVAADRVCGPRSLTGSHYKIADYESCYADAIAQAVAHIDQTSVTSYYRQRWAEDPVSAKIATTQQ